MSLPLDHDAFEERGRHQSCTGFCVSDMAAEELAERMAAADPAVVAGLLSFEVMNLTEQRRAP
jgi:hypothetical protein